MSLLLARLGGAVLTLSAAKGTFVLTGNAATFPISLSLLAVTGIYTVAGKDATLTYATAGGGQVSHSGPFFASVGSLTSLP
jgi:hypothetical protein